MAIKARERKNKSHKQNRDILVSNLKVASEIASILKTSLGPRGMDKMIITEKDSNSVTVTNDGATIMRMMSPSHPIAKLLSELATAQETRASDGTTTAILLAGFMCSSIESLLNDGIHPTIIREIILPLTNLILLIIKKKENLTFKIDLTEIYKKTKEIIEKRENLKAIENIKKEETILKEMSKLEMLIKNTISSKNIDNYSHIFIPIISNYFLNKVLSFGRNLSKNREMKNSENHFEENKTISYEIFKKSGKGIENCSLLMDTLILKAKFPDRVNIPSFVPSLFNLPMESSYNFGIEEKSSMKESNKRNDRKSGNVVNSKDFNNLLINKVNSKANNKILNGNNKSNNININNTNNLKETKLKKISTSISRSKIGSEKGFSFLVDEFMKQNNNINKKRKFKAIFIQTPILSHFVNPKPYIDSSIVIQSYEQIDQIVRTRNENLRTLLKAINSLNSKLGINCIIYMKKITQNAGDFASIFDEKFVNFLNRKSIFVGEMERENFEKACESFGAKPLVRLFSVSGKEAKTEKKEIEFERIERSIVEFSDLLKVDDKHLLFSQNGIDRFSPSFDSQEFSDLKNGINNNNNNRKEKGKGKRIGTLYITASNEVLLDEIERSLEDVLGVLDLLFKDVEEGEGLMMKGGGTFEMECSILLEKVSNFFAQNLEVENFEKLLENFCSYFSIVRDNKSVVYSNGEDEIEICLKTLYRKNLREVVKVSKSLGKSFDNIIIALANNAAMEGIETLGNLREEHKKGNVQASVDILKRRIGSGINAVIPFEVAKSAVELATEFACQVLKIDDFIR